MAIDRHQKEVLGNLLAIGASGNLILNTVGRLAPQEQSGLLPHLLGIGLPTEFSISAAAGAANVCNVSFQLSDMTAKSVSMPSLFEIWLSDAATGAGLTAATATGGIAAVATFGIVWSIQTAAKALRVQANAAGLFKLAITDTAKTAFYPCALNLATGYVVVGTQLITANYG